LHAALELSLDILGGVALSRNLDGELGLRYKGDRLVARHLRRSLGIPRVVVGNAQVDLPAVLIAANMRVVGTGDEGVILGGNVFETKVDSGGALVYDGFDLATRHLGGESVAFDYHVDHGVFVLARLRLWYLNAGAGTLADLLDLRTLAADDEGTDR
jgi:hypothetical protein